MFNFLNNMAYKLYCCLYKYLGGRRAVNKGQVLTSTLKDTLRFFEPETRKFWNVRLNMISYLWEGVNT